MTKNIHIYEKYPILNYFIITIKYLIKKIFSDIYFGLDQSKSMLEKMYDCSGTSVKRRWKPLKMD